MNFAKAAWKLLVGIKDALVLIFLLLFFALLYAGIRAARTVEAAPRHGALYLQLDGPIVEQPTRADSLSALASDGTPAQYRLRDVVHALETAAHDSAIKAVVLDLDGFGGGGQVAMERVAAALDEVRAADKPVLAHATLYDDDSYMLAAHASEIWLSPLGMVGVTGPGGTNLYYKGLLDKIGAKVHVYRVGAYKSAVEPYIRSNMSPDARAANEALVKAVWDDWLSDVGKVRPSAKVTEYLADPMKMLKAAGGDTAKAALDAGLIDKIGDETAFGKHVADLAGQASNGGPGDFAAVPFRAYAKRHKLSNDGGVGVITVAGDIVDGEANPGTAGGTTIANLIHDAMGDDSIKALVLRVDSPGGSVTGAEQIRGALLEAKKQGLPIVVSMGNVAASGGYWVSTAADAIYAEPATITGSIGVFGIVPSFETTLGKLGITTDSVKATALSGEPNVLGGVSPQFDALAQASVDEIYRHFTDIVAKARNLTPERVDEIGQGRVWDGGTAHQLKLVDRFGGIDDAIADAAKRAKLSGSAASAHYFDPKGDRLSEIIAMLSQEDEESRASVRAAAPRDWLSLAALRQRQWGAQAVADLRGLVDGPAIRADCLECRAFEAPRAPTPADKAAAGWLGRLAGFAKDL